MSKSLKTTVIATAAVAAVTAVSAMDSVSSKWGYQVDLNWQFASVTPKYTPTRVRMAINYRGQ